ncbi:hypothetical protein TL16_g09031 [Triparma laevis f. inornata]|uniref:Eukaryotic translation initiation factor 2A n=1 Tax=Triparma laevis f. inornata TaxID=1714386 RepID=A0A9W7EJX5_9STRA|nr:hypothetical protein TL16_g09031 [Triparma laevis f. inornata]
MSALTQSPVPTTSLILRSKTSSTSYTYTTSTLNETTSSSSPCSLFKYSTCGLFVAVKETSGTGEIAIVEVGEEGVKEEGKRVLEGTGKVQVADFSPKSTYFVTWERPIKEGPGNLKIFSTSTGELQTSFHMKNPAVPGVSWPAVEWSSDEKIALRIATNSVFIYRGDAGWSDSSNLLERVSVEGVKQFSVSPGSSYRFTTFTPETKGRPAKVAIYGYPNTKVAVTGKSFYQAEELTTAWSPNGEKCIVFTHTTVDTTGQSYYGSTSLHLLSADGSGEDYAIPLAKEGPVYDVKWCPNPLKPFFIVLSGSMPSQACLFNAKCEQLFLFGEAHRNIVSWSPHGRFVGLCGFGNLAGDFDMWDVNKRKKMGSNSTSAAVGYGWSPDSRQFMVSTTAPRMNVDNGVRIFKYNGAGPITKLDVDVLYEAEWRPAAEGVYPDRPQSPMKKGEPMVARYRPPGAGSKGASFAERLRLEREGKAESKKVDRTTALNAKYRPPVGGAGASKYSGGVVGAAPVGGAPVEKSKNAIKREKQKKKKLEEEKRLKEEQEAQKKLKAAVAPASAPADPGADKEKRIKKVKKLLKQIGELKGKGGGKLNEDQQKKVDGEAALVSELKELEL